MNYSVLNKIYGVNSEVEKLREKGKEINVTSDRVRQIKCSANKDFIHVSYFEQ